MALPLCILVSVGGRRSQRPGPSPTLGSLGPSHQRRHKSRVSLRGPPCPHVVSGTPHGEGRATTPPPFQEIFCLSTKSKGQVHIFPWLLGLETPSSFRP